MLEDVVRQANGRVKLAGIAARDLAGQKVELRGAGRRVATATIEPDDPFTATARAPSRRALRTIRYEARLGTLRSPALKLTRALTVRSAAVRRRAASCSAAR